MTGTIDYPDPPPSSGPHNTCWGSWGVQSTPLRPERWVHNLEHGGVVLLYRCEAGCSAELEMLKSFVASHERTILTEYAPLPMPARFAAVAWGYRLVSDCLDLRAFQAFYAEHFDQGPESISVGPGPECSEFPDL
jgi:hypothetical protein